VKCPSAINRSCPLVVQGIGKIEVGLAGPTRFHPLTGEVFNASRHATQKQSAAVELRIDPAPILGLRREAKRHAAFQMRTGIRG
jgi:hypothetical protein